MDEYTGLYLYTFYKKTSLTLSREELRASRERATQSVCGRIRPIGRQGNLLVFGLFIHISRSTQHAIRSHT